MSVAATIGCSNRTPVPSSEPGPRVAGANDLGLVPPDTLIDLVLALRVPGAVRLNKFLDEQSSTRDVMTADDFATAFSVSAGEYARVLTWLAANGFVITRTTAGRVTISVRAT